MNAIATIHRIRLDETQRIEHTAKVFGRHFPTRLEPFVFDMARRLSTDYCGGFWNFYTLTNDGFYLAPELPEIFRIRSQNGYQGSTSADALGITACLYAYSHLSFTDSADLAETCAMKYYQLREYAFEHEEVEHILKAID